MTYETFLNDFLLKEQSFYVYECESAPDVVEVVRVMKVPVRPNIYGIYFQRTSVLKKQIEQCGMCYPFDWDTPSTLDGFFVDGKEKEVLFPIFDKFGTNTYGIDISGNTSGLQSFKDRLTAFAVNRLEKTINTDSDLDKRKLETEVLNCLFNDERIENANQYVKKYIYQPYCITHFLYAFSSDEDRINFILKDEERIEKAMDDFLTETTLRSGFQEICWKSWYYENICQSKVHPVFKFIDMKKAVQESGEIEVSICFDFGKQKHIVNSVPATAIYDKFFDWDKMSKKVVVDLLSDFDRYNFNSKCSTQEFIEKKYIKKIFVKDKVIWEEQKNKKKRNGCQFFFSFFKK